MKKHMHEQNRLWDYQIIKQLGKGEYGQVYQVRLKKDNKIYALKKIHTGGIHVTMVLVTFRQIKALKLIQHPDIIEYYDSFMSMENIYIVTKFAQKGDLSVEIKNRLRKQKKYTEDQLWNLFEGLVQGVKYLHEKNIIHRDLKLQNIFITGQGKYKIGDLGMSKIIHHPSQLISTRVGTPIYFAPEMIQHKMYSFPVDIWALGCVFYYMATLQHPYKDASIETLGYYVIDKDPKPIKGTYTPQLIQFINSMFVKDPNNRPTIHDIYKKLRQRRQTKINNKISVFNVNLKKIFKMKHDQFEQDASPKKQYRNQFKVEDIAVSRFLQNKSISKQYVNDNVNNNPEWKLTEAQKLKQKRAMSVFLVKPDKTTQNSFRKSSEKQIPQCSSPMIKSNGFTLNNLNKIKLDDSPTKNNDIKISNKRNSFTVRYKNFNQDNDFSYNESPTKINHLKKAASRAQQKLN